MAPLDWMTFYWINMSWADRKNASTYLSSLTMFVARTVVAAIFSLSMLSVHAKKVWLLFVTLWKMTSTRVCSAETTSPILVTPVFVCRHSSSAMINAVHGKAAIQEFRTMTTNPTTTTTNEVPTSSWWTGGCVLRAKLSVEDCRGRAHTNASIRSRR